jgi:hypothetical protein
VCELAEGRAGRVSYPPRSILRVFSRPDKIAGIRELSGSPAFVGTARSTSIALKKSKAPSFFHKMELRFL